MSWRAPRWHATKALASVFLTTLAADSSPAQTSNPPLRPDRVAAALDSAATPVQADSVASPAGGPRTLHVRSGSFRAQRQEGETVIDYEGGVRLESESTTVESRRARQYRSREHVFFYENVVVRDGDVEMQGDEGEFLRPADWAELRGRVRITDPRGTLVADRARYYRTERRLRLWGNVDSHDAQTRVQADSIVYQEDTGLGEAFGNVVVTDVESGSEARGPHAFYDRNTGEARLDPQPLLVLRESGSEDTRVFADEVRMNRDQSVVRARGHVRILLGNSSATADSAVLFRKQDRAELRGSPALEQQRTRLLGREIDVFYRDDTVDRVHVRHDVVLTQSRSDTLYLRGPNQVNGDSAVLHFDAGELRRAVVTGGASSRFVPAESRPGRVSVNEARADSMVILFAGDETEEVIFIGNASGRYRFYEGDLETLLAPAPTVFDSTFGVVRGDTTRVDFETAAETVVYSAERILYLVPHNDLHLQDAAEVEYQSRTLRAGRITFDADTDLLDARDRPVLVDSGDRMYGEEMGYDMTTRKAWIAGGSTTYDQGYYSGRVVRKRQEGVLEVTDGVYTTCDLEQPHYHFKSDRMKIYLKNKVVGRPVKLYLGNVPFGWLPFIVNSVDTGRRSGFLQPDIEFGVAGQSRFIRGLDYYWAASPYFDFLFSSEYQDRARPDRSSVGSVLRTADTRSLRFGTQMRYKKRYSLNGNVSFAIRRSFAGDATFYTLGGAHQQTLGERTTLRGTLDYASSPGALRQTEQNIDIERARERQITSGLNLNRRGDLASFNLNLRRVQRLDPGEAFTGALITRTLPGLSLTFRSIRLAPTPKNRRDMGPVHAFFHSLQFTPNLNLDRSTARERFARTLHAETGVEISPDSARTLPDSLKRLAYDERENERISASTGLGFSRQTSLWILNLSPSMSYAESYVKDSRTPDAKRHRRSFSTGVGASTTFYGLFYPRRFGLTAIRHQIEPRATLSYAPELAGQQLRSQSLTLSLRNQFDVKYDKGGEERRHDGVFDWSLSTSYNPTRLGPPGEPDRKFGNISSGMTVNRPGPLTVSITQTYDPYRGRILSTSIPFAMRFSGRFGYGDTGVEEARRNRVVEEETLAGTDTTATTAAAVPPARREPGQDLEGVENIQVGARGAQTWDLSLSYSLNRELGRTRSGRVGIGFGIQPTRAWNVRYSAAYDLTQRLLGPPAITVTRDLHCWKASFSRRRFSDRGPWAYYFRIYVNKHQEDLFFESGDRGLGW